MRTRWLAAGALVALAGNAVAQTPPRFTAFETAAPPTELPLIPVPGPTAPPAPYAPRGPVGEYDPRYLYLPEPGPEFERRQTLPDELWRVSASVELAWLSTRQLPRTLRLTPPDVFGNRVPGLIVPLDGRGTDPFQAGLGLNLARRVGERGGVDASLFLLPGAPQRIDGYAPGTFVSFPDAEKSAPLLVRFPAGLDGFGSGFPATFSTTFIGADVNYRHAVLLTDTARVDVLAGYRFAYLTDELYLGGDRARQFDVFRENRLQAESTFHGGQLGVAVALDLGAWYTDGSVKLAYGARTTRTSATGAFAFAQPRPHLWGETWGTFLPTVNWKVGYRVTDHAGVFASYSFQYLDHVARLGDAFAPCGARSELWVQALGLGLEWRF